MFFLHFSRASYAVVLTSKTRMGFDIMLGTVTSAELIIFSSNLIRSALVKMPMYYPAFFVSNASAPCEVISYGDSSTLAEEPIEWGGCMISEI